MDPSTQAAIQNRAKSSLRSGTSLVNQYVQAGPSGVSMLCFFVGIATFVFGIVETINNILSLDITHPFSVVLTVYITFFGAVTVVLEADVNKWEKTPVVGPLAIHVYTWQKCLNEYAKFMTSLKGRGGYYILIGALCIVQCMFCPFFLIGASFCFLGVVCIMLSYGYTPDIEKAAEAAASKISQMSSQSAGR